MAYGIEANTPIAEGKLTLINNQVDETTGTVLLKAQFDNEGEPLWPGQSVNARLVLATREDAVTVPQQTVMQGPNGPYVYVLDDRDTAQRRAVTVERTQEGYSVIAKGVAAGDRVVVEGQYRLTDGTKVRVDQAQPASVAQQSAQ